jgi:hypothetical protein
MQFIPKPKISKINMKLIKSILILTTIVTNQIICSKTLAQSQRYPTNAEMQKLLKTFPQVPSNVNSDSQDSRSTSEKQTLASLLGYD